MGTPAPSPPCPPPFPGFEQLVRAGGGQDGATSLGAAPRSHPSPIQRWPHQERSAHTKLLHFLEPWPVPGLVPLPHPPRGRKNKHNCLNMAAGGIVLSFKTPQQFPVPLGAEWHHLQEVCHNSGRWWQGLRRPYSQAVQDSLSW